MTDTAPREASHVLEQLLGGDGGQLPKPKPKRRPHRSPALRVIEQLDDRPVTWEPRPGLPAGGRDECRNGERPCPYVRCKFHLWLVLGDDRTGRRPRGGRASSTLLPAWLEYPTPPCCALDFAEHADSDDPLLVNRIARALHLSRSRTFAIIAAITEKLRARREEQAFVELVGV